MTFHESNADFLQRYLKLASLLDKKSFFLFGPRGTGKSFLIRNSLDLEKINYINLLRSEIYLRLKTDPSQLTAMITSKDVVIDEIQRILNS